MGGPANRVARTGAVMFVCGACCTWRGLSGAIAFANSGPAGVFTGFGGAPVVGEPSATLVLAGHVVLDFRSSWLEMECWPSGQRC
jgi:hypothetical protein